MFLGNKNTITYVTVLISVFFVMGFGHSQNLRGERARSGPSTYHILHIGTALVGESLIQRDNITLLVENDQIARIEDGYLSAQDLALTDDAAVTVADLKDRIALPGLMDAHVHLAYRNVPSLRQASIRNGKSAAENTLIAYKNAQITLQSGFTTVRDVGSPDNSVLALRDEINAGRTTGPTLIVSGQAVSTTGAHADGSDNDDATKMSSRLKEALCDSPDECRRVIRYLHKLGVDMIKITITGGFSSNSGLAQNMTFEEMKSIIDTAHERNLKVTAHAYDPKAIKDAIRAGVDSIEHGFLLDDEGIAMMKDSGAYLVPTLMASLPPRYLMPVLGSKDASSYVLRKEYAALERAYAAGANIAFGTDAGTFNHGENAEEFNMLVEFGVSPRDAIYMATMGTAELFGIAEKAGSLEVGKRADIIAVMENPLENIAILKEIDFVMKAGHIARQNGVATTP